MSNAIQLSDQYELALFPKRNVILERGEGVYLWDTQGRKYLDCASGSGSVNIGHCNPYVVQAITAQANKLITCTGIFHNEARSQFMYELLQVAPQNLKKVFLCNSGAESMEAALKFARVSTGRKNFVCAARAFHGRTMGALTATHNPKYREGFEPLLEGFTHIPFNNIEALDAALDSNVAAFVLEIVQGEGGVYVADAEYLRAAQKLCNERGILLALDEVQTGFCRTGAMFACQIFGIEPDLLCLAKSIAGGIPMGAVLCSDKIQIDVGAHGTTFGGSPLACAAGLAALAFMKDHKLAEAAREKGRYFCEQLRALNSPKVREVRGLGLMIGVQLKEKSTPYLQALGEEGVFAIPAGPTVIRFLPPLIISNDEIDRAVEATGQVLSMDFA